MSAQAVQTGTSTTTTWAIDAAHSLVEFSIKHLMISTVKGRFNTVSGTIAFEDNAPSTGSAEVTIDVASVSTGVEMRDTHLRTSDFFDAAQYPAMTFRSTRVERVDDDEYRVHGELTMHGVTLPVTLDTTFEGQITDPQGLQRVGFSATTSLSRKAYGLGFNMVMEAGGVALGDKIKVELHLEAIRQG